MHDPLPDPLVEQDNDRFLKKAKTVAAAAFEKSALTPRVREEDFYIVWFNKTLQNWKALLSTDRADGLYFEVTYDGHQEQSYVDIYQKRNNVVVTDGYIH